MRTFIVKAEDDDVAKSLLEDGMIEIKPDEIELIRHYIRENVELWNEKLGKIYIDKDRLKLLKKLESI